MADLLTPRRLEEYRAGVDRLWRSPYLRYPKHVHIETLALCPAACRFCPYPTLERKGERMDDALLDKILRDLADIPRDLGFQLSPFLVSDPLVERRLVEVLRRAGRDLPNAVLTLTTSGAALTPKLLDELLAVPTVGYLWFSVNDHRPAEYERLMQLDWPRTRRALELVHAAHAAGRVPFRVVLSRVADGTAADDEFLAWVAREWPGFESCLFNRADWLGRVDETTGAVPDIPCSHWFEICITASGVVALCCMDGKAEWPIGDVRREHVLEVYNKPAFRDLRLRARTRLGADPCRRCTLL